MRGFLGKHELLSQGVFYVFLVLAFAALCTVLILGPPEAQAYPVTPKSTHWQELSLTADETTSEVVEKFGRGGSLITEGGAITVTVYGYNPLTGNMVHLESITSTTIADDSAKSLSVAEMFGFEKGCFKLDAGTATAYWVAGE